MSLTFGNIALLICIGIVSLLIGGGITLFIYDYDGKVIYPIIISLLCAIIIIGASAFGMNWYNTNTASGQRNYKDFQSDINNGIYREITITAEDGREIFYYKGKVDIESNHEDNYIKFESEEGKRYIIYYGIQDTIKIIECEENE